MNFLIVLLFLVHLVFCNRVKDLSDVQHHADSEVHDLQYDQEAFLGKDRAEEYSKLSIEERKTRLKKLVEEKIDANKDGKISVEEMKDWIEFVSKSWISEERDRSWDEYNPTKKDLLDFKTYSDINYGDNIDERYSGADLKRVIRDIDLDKKKWQLADENNDGFLSKEELLAFVRPEEDKKMKPFLIDELLVKSDKNGDGYIDKEEYIDELYSREPDIVRGKDPEPEWLKSEKEHFSIHRDTNKDGKMDRHEIGEWISPDSYDGPEAETAHLFAYADTNKDGVLTMDEIMEHSELFVSSQATNYGSTLDKLEL